MKKLFLFLMFLVTFFILKSQDLMNLKPTGFVNDYENIFSSDQKSDLEKILSDYEKKTSIEFCLVTTSDFDFSYSNKLFEKWGVGKKGLNNGLMIIISKTQREFSIEPGYGLEPYLPDLRLSDLTNEIFPNTLSKGDYYGGMKQLILACQSKLGDKGFDSFVESQKLKKLEQERKSKEVLNWALFILFAIIVIGAIVYFVIKLERKMRKLEKLKQDTRNLVLSIENIKSKLGVLPKELENAYNSMPDTKIINEDVYSKILYVYTFFLDYKQTINTIYSSIESIKKSKLDIEKYLQDNYPYCNDYLKNELNNFIPETQIEEFNMELNAGDFTKNRMN